jgi:flagellin
LFNTSGASISVSDATASSATKFDGRSGFSTVQNFNGFLRLESTNGGPISVETNYDAVGHSRSDEAVALAQLGLVRTVSKRTLTGTEDRNDAYTVYGAGITASTTEWVKGEISLNGVNIWRDGQSTSTTAKKVDLINSFSDQTGVTADRVSDDDGMLVIRLNSVNNTPIAIDLGNSAASDLPGLGGYATHGLREQNVGAADFDTNKPTISVGGGNSVSGLNILTTAAATTAITTVDKAIATVDAERAKLGAYQNRLTSTVNNLTNVVTNTEQSRSRIMDTDYSKETTALAKAQIVSQAATAMLAQANQMPQSVLSLLK